MKKIQMWWWLEKEQIYQISMTGNLDGGEVYQKHLIFQSKKKENKIKTKKITTTSTGFTKVNEVTDKEISSLQNIKKGLKKLQQDYTKIYNIGDKTLKDRKYNVYYKSILLESYRRNNKSCRNFKKQKNVR